MLYILDTANINEIKRVLDMYPLDGITTNPTIISKERRDFKELLSEIRNAIGERMLHVQTLGTEAQDIVKEGEYLTKLLGRNTYIKVPVIPEGIKAMKILKAKGINITATAVFTPQQALVAAKSGADFVAPYVNRLDNISGDGVRVVLGIIELFNKFNVSTKVIAASFKNVQQVHKVSLAGAHAVTISPDIYDNLVKFPLTEASVEKFIKDWESVYGKGKLTVDT
ncbi:fructose-6-phosphate aldolase [Caldisalinibacter kiritimatiensis]|uniref:Transaldolase n=1 Tax=Caldisalinibacter kiritimatiensis TaxID=1304284 RepID=R1ASA7_9FIRM|nr:fructose-6-phosphate aldolase [Caldisalinibacter kiritimatiensis]EOD00008.1 Transaldolase [Caldisalinibacter kiritimatiensis]